MQAKELKVGAKLVVSTTDGDEEDEVTRILVESADAGLWVVETLRNGRVIVMGATCHPERSEGSTVRSRSQ